MRQEAQSGWRALACMLAVAAVVPAAVTSCGSGANDGVATSASSHLAPTANETVPVDPTASEKSAGQALAVVTSGQARYVRPVDPSLPIRVTFVLRQRDIAAMRALGDAIADRNSPEFMHYLTFEEAKERFSPRDEDVDDVMNWAGSQGLQEFHRPRSNRSIQVSGTVADVNKALSLQINEYEYDGLHFFANDRTAALPTDISKKVRDIFGLESKRQFHHTGSKKPYVNRPAPAPSKGPYNKNIQSWHGRGSSPGISGATRFRPQINGAHGGAAFEPPDLWSSQAYNFGTLAQFTNCCDPIDNFWGTSIFSSIALVENNNAYGYDIQAFVDEYGIAGNGSIIDLPYEFTAGDGGDTDGDKEATLDIEWAAAMAAPSTVYYSSAPNIYSYAGGKDPLGQQDLWNTWVAIEEADVARIMSASVGNSEDWYCTDDPCWTDPSLGSFYDIANGLRLTGYTLIAAAGDTGAYDNGHGISVNYPASDPHFVAIGGTALSLVLNGEPPASGAYVGEPSWTWLNYGSNQGAGGGGCSSYFQPDNWTPSDFTSHYSDLCLTNYNSPPRVLPDISLNAGNPAGQIIRQNGEWTWTGGTSIGAPEFAGFVAQENSYLASIALAAGICTTGTDMDCNVGLGPYAPAVLYEVAPGAYWSTANPGYTGAPHNPYYDIISGNNCPNYGQCSTNGFGQITNGYQSTTGYDLTTGLGSFNALQLAWALNWAVFGGGLGNTVVVNTSSDWNLWPTLHTSDQTIYIEATTAAPGGIAGFDYMWDFDYMSDPALGDPSSEPTPGSGNPFFDGPKHLGPVGQTTLAEAGPGCHLLYVRAWDVFGFSAMTTYGPVCYESCTDEIPSYNTNFGTACGSQCLEPTASCCGDAECPPCGDTVCPQGDVCVNGGSECCPSGQACGDQCLTCAGFLGDCGGVTNSCDQILLCADPCAYGYECNLNNVCVVNHRCERGYIYCDGSCIVGTGACP